MDKEIIMGCCEPVLGPIENYYTKPTIDRKLAEITSAITSGCCITPEQVDEKIDEAISGITVSGVTEEELNEAIASAKAEIEGEIPTVPTSNTAFTNDAGYLTEHQSLSGYATEAFVSGFTYDKATIDEKVAGGGSFDPSQYYNKTATDALLDEKADLSSFTAHTSNTTIHVTPEQVASWNVKSDFSGDYDDLTNKPTIPTVPTDISAFNNDVGYITGVDLSNYATKDNLTAATDDMATKTWVNNQGYLTEHQSLTAYSTTEQVNSAITQAVSGKQDTLISGTSIKTINNESLLGSGNITIQGGGATYTAGTGIDITDNVISSTLPLSAGTGSKSIIEGYHVNIASGAASHAEGLYTEAKNIAEHASGRYNVSHTGNTTAASTLFSVGNGDEKTRRNAFEIRQNGDIYIRKNNTDVRLQDITPGIWCGTMAEYQQISGSTDNNTIYLIHS